MTQTEPPTEAEPAAYSLKAAARALSISERSLQRLIAEGRMKSIRLGARRLVPAAEVRRAAAEGCNPAAV